MFSVSRVSSRSLAPAFSHVKKSSILPTRRVHLPPTGGSSKEQIVDIGNITKRLGVRLTKEEFDFLKQKVDGNGDGLVSKWELTKAGRTSLQNRSAREVCMDAIEQPTTMMDWLGHYTVMVFDYGGTALYAVVGAQIAGEAGMNGVGCTLVGCAAALGGGTLNNVLYGVASPLHGRPGVFWVRMPSYLMVAVASSLATFFLWPVYCQYQADRYLENMIGRQASPNEPKGQVGERTFCLALELDPKFQRSLVEALGKKADNKTPKEIFQMLDTNGSGTLDRSKLRRLVQHIFDNSALTYAMDSLALGAFAVAAVHGAISVGVHPMVAASSGVTICFGGIIRDVLCGRSLAIGAQSYAFATGMGATVYVILREMALRGIHNNLFARVMMAFSTTVGLRAWEYIKGEPLLSPMYDNEDEDLL
jgi:uncharacterized membrane protein YeiH